MRAETQIGAVLPAGPVGQQQAGNVGQFAAGSSGARSTAAAMVAALTGCARSSGQPVRRAGRVE